MPACKVICVHEKRFEDSLVEAEAISPGLLSMFRLLKGFQGLCSSLEDCAELNIFSLPVVGET
jgi:hypothetical protein